MEELERSNPLCELQIAIYMLEIERHGKEVGSVTSIPRFQRLGIQFHKVDPFYFDSFCTSKYYLLIVY